MDSNRQDCGNNTSTASLAAQVRFALAGNIRAALKALQQRVDTDSKADRKKDRCNRNYRNNQGCNSPDSDPD